MDPVLQPQCCFGHRMSPGHGLLLVVEAFSSRNQPFSVVVDANIVLAHQPELYKSDGVPAHAQGCASCCQLTIKNSINTWLCALVHVVSLSPATSSTPWMMCRIWTTVPPRYCCLLARACNADIVIVCRECSLISDLKRINYIPAYVVNWLADVYRLLFRS